MRKGRKAKAIAIPNGWQGRNGFPRGTRNRDSELLAFSEMVERNSIRKEATPDSTELSFYHAHFAGALAEKNRRYAEKDRSERTQTVEEMYSAPKTAPEEIIFKIETQGNEAVDQNRMEKLVAEHFGWERETFQQAHYFSYHFHKNEPAASDYVQARRVWIAHDKEGNEIVSEREALREMGISRPDESQKENRYNSAKMTHAAKCRAHLEELFASHGLDIKVTLWKRGKHGLKVLSLVPRK